MRRKGIRLVTASLLGLAVLLGTGPAHATGQAYSTLQADWLWQVQELLRQAAVNGERWPTEREQIERHIDGIGYSLQQAVVAEYFSDLRRAEAHLRRAVELLEEGIRRGYFELSEAQQVMTLVREYREVIKV